MITNSQKQIVRDMRQSGLSYTAIADALGLSANTIKSFCRRGNITTKKHIQDDCKNCGKPLLHQLGKKKKQFCSDKCRSDWWNNNRHWARYEKRHILICHHCGAEFNSFGDKKRKYCSRDCYVSSRYGEGLP